MKKILLTLFVTAFSALMANAEEGVMTTPVLKVVMNDGSETSHLLMQVKEVTFSEILYNGYEGIDLGLPSGTLWATMNVGAEAVTDYGYYFAWGETEAKETYDWSEEGDYKWGVYDSSDSNYGMTKYNDTESLTTLEPEDDAANAIWGGEWCMPTISQINELINYCTWEWTTNYKNSGVAGYVVTGENGNSIFLPAAGCYQSDSIIDAGSTGYYWSSLLYSSEVSFAQDLVFNSSEIHTLYNYRFFGYSVRPVRSSSSSE